MNTALFEYSCECNVPTCGYVFTLSHDDYLRLAAYGPVLYLECEGVNGRTVLDRIECVVAVNGIIHATPPPPKPKRKYTRRNLPEPPTSQYYEE